MSGHNKAFLGADYSKIETFKVFVCGFGALGSNLMLGLAQEGYKALSGVDFDRVDRANAYTQVYGLRDNGGKKTAVMRGILAKKLGLRVEVHDCKLEERNVRKLLTGYDLVIDTFDNWESRMIVQQFCEQEGIACLHGGMSEQGYSEIRWNEGYHAPAVQAVQADLCEYPLAGPLVKVTAALLQTAATHYAVTGKRLTRTFTLRDCAVRNF